MEEKENCKRVEGDVEYGFSKPHFQGGSRYFKFGNMLITS